MSATLLCPMNAANESSDRQAKANCPSQRAKASRALARACDACHVRRTKCSGGSPCLKCNTSRLRCTYVRPARKKGPKGKTINMLQATLWPASDDSDDASSVATTSAVTLTPNVGTTFSTSDANLMPWADCELPSMPLDLFDSQKAPDPLSPNIPFDFSIFNDPTNSYPIIPFPDPSPSSLPSYLHLSRVDTSSTPSARSHPATSQLVLMSELLAKSLQRYLRHVQRLFPIVDPDRLQERFRNRVHLHDQQFAAFLLAACALSLFASAPLNVSHERKEEADAMMDMAINLHNTSELGSKPSLDCIGTSMLLAAVALVSKGPAVAFVRHREAIALAESLNLADPKAYDAFDPVDRESFLRILWMLAIAERSNSLLLLKPTTIRSSLSSLPVEFRLQSGLTFGMVPTAKLFETITPALIDCINGQCTPPTCTFSTRNVLVAHAGLEEVNTEGCVSDVQIADTVLTAQWLHIKLWQGCATHSILNATPGVPELAIEYPLKVLAKVGHLVETMSRRSILCNGHAMGKKLGNIADVCQTALSLPGTLIIPAEFRSKTHAMEATAKLQVLASEVATQRWIRWVGDQCDCCKDVPA